MSAKETFATSPPNERVSSFEPGQGQTKNFNRLRQKAHYPRILVVVTLPSDDCGGVARPAR